MENMNTHIKESIETCEACQKQKVITTKSKENIIPNVPSRIFEHMFVDICGPMKTTWHQEKYIFAIIDQFSKNILLAAINKQDEQTIAETIMNKWILKYGTPKQIQLNCGKAFESKVMSELADKYNIKLIYSSLFHHSGNGLIERQF